MKKILVCIFIYIVGAICVACNNGSSTLSDVGETVQGMPEPSASDAETLKGQSTESEPQSETEKETLKETQTEVPQETIVEYELNTVESLEDDGKEMSVAEALRSTMKGRHSALELFDDERLFYLERSGSNIEPNSANRGSIEDMPDTGLARINMLTYNRRGFLGGITPNAASWERFVCVDLDGNGTKEVIIYGGPYIVLHCVGTEVYMTSIYSRMAPYIIYENGVWEASSGAFDRQLYRLYPAKGAIYRENLTYEYIVPDYGDPSFNQYKIMGKDVTEEELNAYLEELIGGLTPLEWHEFTEENINKYVVD